MQSQQTSRPQHTLQEPESQRPDRLSLVAHATALPAGSHVSLAVLQVMQSPWQVLDRSHQTCVRCGGTNA